MALSVIIVLYVCVGTLAAAGSIFISQKLFSAKAEQIFFALFLVAIAAFYLAFTAYFADAKAWRFETLAVALFAIFAIVGLRVPSLLIIGYLLHGVWDVLHEVQAFGRTDLFGRAPTYRAFAGVRRFLRVLRLVHSGLLLHPA
jgi:Family of unknown function (DUF6010)